MRKIPLVFLFLGACQSSGTAPSAKPEVADTQIKLDLPAPPAFENPKSYPDGTHSVLEMRRHGSKYLDQDVKVTAYVVWIYDCAAVHGAEVVKNTPEKCDKPHFRLGDTPDAREDQQIEVVDVPRMPREDEKKVLPPEEYALQEAAFKAIPAFALGSKVVVQGKWAQRSPKGFMNSDGLLVFGSLTQVEPPPGQAMLPPPK